MNPPYESAISFIKQSLSFKVYFDHVEHAIHMCKTFIDYPKEYIWLNPGVDDAKLVLEELYKINKLTDKEKKELYENQQPH